MIPIKGRKLMTAAYYQGGNTVVDFTDLSNVREVGFADLEDATGKADSWSTYWYNGKVVVNGGLNGRGPSANRGVDVFKLTGSLGERDEEGEALAVLQPADAGGLAGAVIGT